MELTDLGPSVTRRLLVVAASIFALPSIAEEGGSGHYFPGSMSSFIDGVPSKPGFLVRGQYIGYDGSAEANREFPFAGQIAANVDAETTALGLTFVWAPDWDLGEKWSYAMTATIPWVDITVAADVSDAAGGPTIRRSDSESGLGDVVLIPAMFRYKVNPDLNFDARLAFYAPTGDYEVGRLANPGKNFWSVEPTVALMYFGQQNGREASIFLGATFNQENPDTEYKSGTQMHLDMTFAQHFPLWGGLAGAGLSGFWYEQVQGDSGAGATLGDFKAKAHGAGPVLSFIKAVDGHSISLSLKWLREFNNRNRLEGDIIWAKLVGSF